ncbi:unnamed protein product, partial [Mesorhabditis spiculigera]
MAATMANPNRQQQQDQQQHNGAYRYAMPGRVVDEILMGEGPGRRLRKNVANVRRHVDYVPCCLNLTQSRLIQFGRQDRRAAQPDELYQNTPLPPAATPDKPVDCVNAKFVRAAMNKVKCPVYTLAWTPEGKRLITGASTGEFTLWNGVAFNFETILQAHDAAIRSMTWSANGHWLISGDAGGFIKYWQPNMNNVHMFLAHKEEAVRGLKFGPTDAKFVSGSDDGTAKIWDFARFTEEFSLRGHGSEVRCIDWHPTKSLICSGSRDTQQPVKLWDAISGKCVSTLQHHKSSVMAVEFNRNGNWLLTSSRDQLVKLYDIRTMKVLKNFRGHKKEVTSLAWHPVHEGLFVTGGGDGSIAYWLVDNDKEEDIFGLASYQTTLLGTSDQREQKNMFKDQEKNQAAPIIPGMGLDEEVYQEMNRDVSSVHIGMSIDEFTPGQHSGARRTLIKQPPAKKAQRQFERMWNVAKPGTGEDSYDNDAQMDEDPYAKREKTSLLGAPPPSASMLGSGGASGGLPPPSKSTSLLGASGASRSFSSGRPALLARPPPMNQNPAEPDNPNLQQPAPGAGRNLPPQFQAKNQFPPNGGPPMWPPGFPVPPNIAGMQPVPAIGSADEDYRKADEDYRQPDEDYRINVPPAGEQWNRNGSIPEAPSQFGQASTAPPVPPHFPRAHPAMPPQFEPQFDRQPAGEQHGFDPRDPRGAPPQTNFPASTMPSMTGKTLFRDFASKLQAIRRVSGYEGKTDVMRKFLTEVDAPRGAHNPYADLLLSAENEELNDFRAGVVKLKQMVAKSIGLKATDITFTNSGNVYQSLRELIAPINERYTPQGGFYVEEVHDRLKLLMAKGSNSDQILHEFYETCDSNELLWIFAVVTKSVVTALKWDVSSLRDALFPGGNQKFKENRDYKKRLQSEQPDYPLMCNFEPMLLARLDIGDWYKKIDDHAGSNFLMELKFDGEHVVIHKKFDDWRVVTRNGKDFTKYYNGAEGNKNLIEAVRPYFRNDANEFVIDCELMLYDEVGKCFVRHHQVCADGQTYNFQHIKPADPVHLAVVVLDVLYLNGNNFMGTSFEKRIKVLEKLLLKKQDPTLIFIPERKTGNTKEDVRAYFKQSMENGDEGIVVKAISTLYTPGKRLASNGWFKVKANLTEGAHLDVAIVGVKYVGTAREQELVIAVKKPFNEYAEPANDATFDLKVIGSVGAGLTHDERRWVLDEGRRMGALLSDPPAGVQGAPIKDGGYFRDWDDFKVVEVRCAGKQNGALQHAGLVRLRNDKDLKDLDTYRDFKELDEEAAASRKRPAKQPQISRAKLAREGVKQDAKAEKIDDGLEGQFVCVIPGRSDKKLAELVEILKGFGATVQALPDDQTKFLVAVDRNVPQTKKRVKEARYCSIEFFKCSCFRWTIVAEAWLRRCKERGEIVEWTPEETLYDVGSTTKRSSGMRAEFLFLVLICVAQALPTREISGRPPTYAMINNMPFVPRADLTPERYIRNRRSYTILTPEYSILDDIF